MILFRKAFALFIRELTAWAWAREIAITEGCAVIEKINSGSGGWDLEIKTNPDLGKAFGQALANMVCSAPNYMEMQFLVNDPKDPFKYVTVLVQKHPGETPHQMRQRAEKERDELKAQLAATQ
jgi:hypothetical protein